MRIRPLTPSDEPFLWEALYHAIHVPPGEAPPPREVIDLPELASYVSGWMEHPDDLGFGAEVNGALIGAVWLQRWTEDTHGYGFVDAATPELTIAVLPGYRGQGVGTQLVRRVLDAAAARFAAVSLSVSLTNPARRLYEREGFVAIGEIEGDSITMIKRFAS